MKHFAISSEGNKRFAIVQEKETALLTYRAVEKAIQHEFDAEKVEIILKDSDIFVDTKLETKFEAKIFETTDGKPYIGGVFLSEIEVY